MKKNINFEDESIDITKECSIYLIENDFFKNDKLTNLKLLEQSLINYTILKLYSWKIDLEKLETNNFSNLDTLLKTTSSFIPTEYQKAYFVQYIHCILYIYGKINKQSEITWNQTNNQLGIVYDYSNNALKEIETGIDYDIYEIPTLLLKELKYINQEKNPVLIK